MCHAEVNAVLNKNSSDCKDCTMYVALFPCNECAKIIIQSSIKTVIYMSDKYADKVQTIAAKKMFDAAGVKYRYFHLQSLSLIYHCNPKKILVFWLFSFRQYIPKHKKIEIDFDDIDCMNQSLESPMKENAWQRKISTYCTFNIMYGNIYNKEILSIYVHHLFIFSFDIS